MAKPVPYGEERRFGIGITITKDFIDNNRNKVLRLAQLGCTPEEIGFVINASDRTVRKYFGDELDRGLADLKSSLRKAQLECALNERNVTMLLWLGKQFLGQRDPKANVEHSGSIKIEKVIFSINDEEDTDS